MTNYRRANFPGGNYFFTVVTHNRQDLFSGRTARLCRRHAWREIKNRRPFELVAICLLPNQTFWQRRFWEHQIKDETDLQNHIDYIHYNPIKHRLVDRLEDWPWSNYHRYVRQGFYGGKSPQFISKAAEAVLCAGE